MFVVHHPVMGSMLRAYTDALLDPERSWGIGLGALSRNRDINSSRKIGKQKRSTQKVYELDRLSTRQRQQRLLRPAPELPLCYNPNKSGLRLALHLDRISDAGSAGRNGSGLSSNGVHTTHTHPKYAKEQ